MLNNIDYGTRGIRLDDIHISNSCNLTVTVEKSFFDSKNTDQFFIKIYKTDHTGTSSRENLGYLYFYLNPITKTSSYIGTYVKPEYRSLGLASMLSAYWIKLCLDEGYDFLETTKAQRKPYLLFILKKVFFEIDDPEKYNLSKHTIHICKSNEGQRFLLFKKDEYAMNFQKSNIYQNDDYRIMLLGDLDCGIVLNKDGKGNEISSDDIVKLLEKSKHKLQLLDRVLLSNIYTLKDNNAAYGLVTQRLNEKEEIIERKIR